MTHLSTGAGVFCGVRVDEDVDPSVDDGCLQGGDAHPPVCELRESPLLLQLQHALVTLVTEQTVSEASKRTKVALLQGWWVNYIFSHC